MNTIFKSGNKHGFVAQAIFWVFVVAIAFWCLVRFGLTYDLAQIRKNLTKVDGEAIFISGKVIEARVFPEIPVQGASYMGMNIQTRKGPIWVLTLKDKPTVGTKYFMEVEVIGTIERVNKRFALPTPLTSGSNVAKILPILIEKSRIGLPFTF